MTEHGFLVRTATDVSQARREIDAFDPDMLLLDVSLGEGPTGVHLAHAIRLSRPDIAILVFTSQADVASANNDGLGLPPGVGLLRKHLVSNQAYLIESRTLRLLAEGYDNDEIARRCGVSRKTVERWIEQVYRDLGIETKGLLNPRVAAARRFFLSVGIPSTRE
jgi:DNA-binding NarL/FixJ family response regulator